MFLKSSYKFVSKFVHGKFVKVMVNKMKHASFIPSCNHFASSMVFFMLALNTYPVRRMFFLKYSLLICNRNFL